MKVCTRVHMWYIDIIRLVVSECGLERLNHKAANDKEISEVQRSTYTYLSDYSCVLKYFTICISALGKC